MHELGIDIETYSDVDIKKSGLYKYCESPNFDILLVSWSLDGGDVATFDLAGARDIIPDWFIAMLHDPNILKTAHNAAFEITALSAFLQEDLDPSQWECTAVRGTMLGYPRSLEQMAKALDLDVQKDLRGKALIKYFSVPCKPTNSNRLRERNLPHHDPVKWQQYVDYNVQDVVVEQVIRNTIRWFSIPPFERELWLLDQKINKLGIKLDINFVEQVLTINEVTTYRLVNEAKEITGLANPNSIQQLKAWLDEQCGRDIGKLTKDNIKELLKEGYADNINRVLEIRQELAKTSIKKFMAMRLCYGLQDRVRGMFQFYGANKTGRWSAGLVQLHNLPQNKLPDLHIAREVAASGNANDMELLFGNVSDTLSQLVRTAFIAEDGKTLLVTDFSAIEARVLAWFANERWRLDVFNSHGKIYEASASQMFKIPLDQVTKDVRQKGKIAELALGYQGSVGAMEKMGALKMGLSQEELLPIVRAWRKANPNIVNLWYYVAEAAIEAVENPGKTIKLAFLKFQVKNDVLFIKLPSGRCLTYIHPKTKEGHYGKVITFFGVDQETKKWTREETYGGKLVENIVQGTARDLLGDAMLRLDKLGYIIPMHVHDEIVLEVDEGRASDDLDIVNAVMRQEVSWAPGLPLKGESYCTKFYKKD